jgi:serpin B
MKGILVKALVLVGLASGCGPSEKAWDITAPPAVESPARAGQAEKADTEAVARGNNDFAFDLHRKLSGDNVLVSPFSVSAALAMTYAGAKGETAAEMAKALRFPFEGDRLHLGCAGLLGSLSDTGALLKP